jgi:ATP:ADP antiporter, AAA family
MDAGTRVMRLVVDVKKREAEPALLFFLFWFFVIIVFQALRPLKKGLFVEHLGANVELYAKLANIGVAILAVVVFSYLYSRLGSRRLIPTLCVIFIAALLGFASAIPRDGAPAVWVNWSFYLFGDLWSTIWVTTFWAYLNEMTRIEQSKRLYGMIGAGGPLGGLVANLAVWQFVKEQGTATILVGCAVATVVVGLIMLRLEMLARQANGPIGREETDLLKIEERVTKKERNPAIDGARLVFASRYLLAIAAIVFLYEITSQILDYQYSSAADVAVEGSGATQAFFAQIGTIVNGLGLIVSLFLVSFVMRRFGLKTALLILPVAMAIASGIYVVVPVLITAALLTISDNAFSYSMNQTARETLFEPTSDDVVYKARAFINMFVQRLGKGAAILMALALGAIQIRFLSILALVVIVIWAGFALYAGRRFDTITGDDAKRRLERAAP